VTNIRNNGKFADSSCGLVKWPGALPAALELLLQDAAPPPEEKESKDEADPREDHHAPRVGHARRTVGSAGAGWLDHGLDFRAHRQPPTPVYRRTRRGHGERS
jgi:hypothetical protein